jgi:formate hydrogenlyase subunit 3/multisubunit Na+/H+ antiporter MnhD subunit
VRISAGVFWTPAPQPGGGVAVVSGKPSRSRSLAGGPPLMVVPTALLVAAGLAIAFAAGPLYSLSERTARDLLHPAEYVHAVLGQ